jgi:tRNA (guanine-N7-)-methyltransferase
VIARAAGKLEGTGIRNAALVSDDISNIGSMVPEGSIGRIYLNFLDPWPKKRHEKRRCTSPAYLELYRKVLKDGGELHFKTDSTGFYEYTLCNIMENSFKVIYKTDDLYGSEYIESNIQTEYEKKFLLKGEKIKKIAARK